MPLHPEMNMNIPDPPSLDAVLAKELNELSLEQREKVYYDVHGVSEAVEETPESIRKSLQEIDLEISKIHPKAAYDRANEQNENPGYVNNPKFLLMFLRAANFDSKSAAERVVRFLDEKLKLFGPAKLAKELHINDMDDENRKCLQSGVIQVLPLRDRAGRAIVTWMPQLRGKSSIESRMRSIFCAAIAVAEDEETQKKGVVLILINAGPNKISDPYASWKVSRVMPSLCVRFVGIHYCYDSVVISKMFSLTMMMAGKESRLRFRTHFGSFSEFHYELMTFGLPTKVLPFDVDGNLHFENHRNWIDQQRQKKQQPIGYEQQLSIRKQPTNSYNPHPRISVPAPLDVLMGREKISQEHTGNFRYNQIIQSRLEKYDNGTKQEKTQMATEILEVVKGYGGRFLKLESGSWVQVDDRVAREKVSNGFRSKRKTGGAKCTPCLKTEEDTSRKKPFPSSYVSGDDCLASTTSSESSSSKSKRPRDAD